MEKNIDKQTEEILIKFVFDGVRPTDEHLEQAKKILKNFTKTLEMSN